ncbi:MAG: excisionase family DNA-binding protein, partial [Gammaproteobacteria bacterium]
MAVSTYLSTREAADLLGVSLRTVQLWVESGTLRAWKTAGG